MGIRREPAAGRELAPEVGELGRRKPAFEKRARVDAGRGVPLEVDEVARRLGRVGAEEMMEADLEQRRERGVGRDVTADAARVLVRLHHHRRRVPADQVLDAALDLAVAGVGRLRARGMVFT